MAQAQTNRFCDLRQIRSLWLLAVLMVVFVLPIDCLYHALPMHLQLLLSSPLLTFLIVWWFSQWLEWWTVFVSQFPTMMSKWSSVFDKRSQWFLSPQVLSGCAIIVRGQPRGGPPPERQINLSNIRTGALARRAAQSQPESKDTQDEVNISPERARLALTFRLPSKWCWFLFSSCCSTNGYMNLCVNCPHLNHCH